MSKYTPIMRVWGVVAAICGNMFVLQASGLEESTGPGGSNAIAVHQLGRTGQDVNIGLILSRNVLTTHEAFIDDNGVGHAFNYDFSGSGISPYGHDTQLAGIISSRGGMAFPNDIGVAPGADIHCARVASWYDINEALTAFINTHNCRVIVTGFAYRPSDFPPDGNSNYTMLYDYYAYQYGVIFANAAGNQYSSITVFGDAYNGITTGGLRLTNPANQFDYRWAGLASGSGLTADGRRKPDITAPSESQRVPTVDSNSSNTAWTITGTTLGETSWSVPQAAGAAAVLLGLANETPGPNDNRNEVIKAVVVNSAMPNINNKGGISTNPADSNNTWQADRGYGRLDVLRAYQTLDTNELEPNTNPGTPGRDKGWGYGRLSQGQANTYTISVTARCRLIATMTWQRRVTKSGTILNGYLANLDMIVYAPGEPNEIFSKELFGFSPNDNLVKCDLLVLTPGDYTIMIENNSDVNEPANYGFAFELHPILPADISQINYAVDINDLEALTQDWLTEDSQYDALLSPNGIIDFADFAILADAWLQIDPFYYQF